MTVEGVSTIVAQHPITVYIKRVKGITPMLVSEYYMVSAVTPEDGEVSYETLDQQLARSIHSELLGRQLNKDGTHSVTVRVPTRS